MFRHALFLLLILLLSAFQAWTRFSHQGPDPGMADGFWVFFTDKQGVEFDPHAYFHENAIGRRLSLGLCLYDSLDFPVRADYLDSLTSLAGAPSVVSRWLNAAHVRLSAGEAIQLETLDFVKKVIPVSMRLIPAAAKAEPVSQAGFEVPDSALLSQQIRHMSGQAFAAHGFDGRSIRIAIFDSGFSGVEEHPAFAHIIGQGRIIGSWDFHRSQENVFTSGSHGTMVLSVIGGMLDGLPMGLATGAEFLLARTEIFRELLVEEKYWLAAVEWADRHGAHIINSSLGYVFHRYFPEQMDGQTSLVARAAHIAASKGILIINAAGNEGNNEKWRIVVTPADADSVLTVGALSFPSLLRAPYSSTGPTADGRLKPNVSALGTVVAAGRRGLATPRGTSFASPLVAGFAACLWQMNPSWTNMDVFRAIERSSTLYPYYDYAHGVGIPQADYFLSPYPLVVLPTFDIMDGGNDTLKIVIRQNPAKDQNQTDKATIHKYIDYLYYKIMGPDSGIEQYFVVEVSDANILKLGMEQFGPGRRLLVHYKGYTSAVSF